MHRQARALLGRYGVPVQKWQRVGGRTLVDALLPPRCPITDELVRQQGTFSATAWSQFQLLAPPWCSLCGFPFGKEAAAETLCVSCTAPSRKAGRLTGEGGLSKIRSAFAYSDAIAPAILRLKYSDRTDGVHGFATVMDRVSADLYTDGCSSCLLPVPLHPSRLRKRRYNQSGLLAEAIGRLRKVPVLHGALRRSKKTPPQGGTSREARFRNVAGAFSIDQPEVIKGQSIILVDDVLTSGATLLACAIALRQAGAKEVSALTLARVVKSAQNAPYEYLSESE